MEAESLEVVDRLERQLASLGASSAGYRGKEGGRGGWREGGREGGGEGAGEDAVEEKEGPPGTPFRGVDVSRERAPATEGKDGKGEGNGEEEGRGEEEAAPVAGGSSGMRAPLRTRDARDGRWGNRSYRGREGVRGERREGGRGTGITGGVVSFAATEGGREGGREGWREGGQEPRKTHKAWKDMLRNLNPFKRRREEGEEAGK